MTKKCYVCGDPAVWQSEDYYGVYICDKVDCIRNYIEYYLSPVDDEDDDEEEDE